MKEVITKIRSKIIDNYLKESIIFVYNFTILVVALIFYPLIPILLNYPPGTVNSKFQVQVEGLTYNQQYILIVLLNLIVGYMFLDKMLKNFSNWKKILKVDDTNRSYLWEKCLSLPYIIYTVPILICIVLIITIDLLIKTPLLVMLKTVIVFFSFATLAGLIVLIFSRNLLKKVLIETYKGESLRGIRINLRSKIFLCMVPTMVVVILFTSLIGYSRLIEEKGELLFKINKTELTNNFINIKKVTNKEELLRKLDKIKVEGTKAEKFIISPEGKIEIINNPNAKLNDTFIKYIKELSDNLNGRVYDYDGENQGAVIKLKGDKGNWIVGVKYVVASRETIIFFLTSFIILLGLNSFVLSYFSKSIADDISLVARSLTEIAEGGNDLTKKLPVTSNDEIGDLVIAFNKIQDLTRENIEKIQATQKQLAERERLATLGELAAGVAHDINGPLSVVKGGLGFIKQLFQTYTASLDDGNVKSEERKNMENAIWQQITNSINACEKILNIVNSIRNHTRNISGENVRHFYIREVMEDLKLLLNYQLKHSGCELVFIEEEENILIKGDPGKLEQVLTNLIINAIQAYEGKPGRIEVRVKKDKNKIVITVSDNAGGIPEEIRAGIFNKIITTKGTQGTGLGLYVSNSIVIGHFGGKMEFETETGKGTTFFVKIPIDTKGDFKDVK